MSTKKRDLAQELVEFLLKEEERKKPVSVQKEGEGERVKPQLVTEQKTVALAGNEIAPLELEFNVGGLEKTEAPIDLTERKKTLKILMEPLSAPVAPSPAPAPVIDINTSAPVPEMKNTNLATNSLGNITGSKPFPTQRASIVFNDVSSLLAGTEAVKVAQARITTLEKEKEQLRTEIEQLLTSSESLQRRLNELKATNESMERKHREKIEILEDEKAVIKTRLNAKETELSSIKKENEDLLERFKSDLRKIRVRERELEHRQEIIRAEMVTVVSGKDEVIVELKRQLEKLHFELDNFRAKSADLTTKINEFYDRNHRTVKALRLALSVLETGDADDKAKSKPDGKKDGS